METGDAAVPVPRHEPPLLVTLSFFITAIKYTNGSLYTGAPSSVFGASTSVLHYVCTFLHTQSRNSKAINTYSLIIFLPLQ